MNRNEIGQQLHDHGDDRPHYQVSHVRRVRDHRCQRQREAEHRPDRLTAAATLPWFISDHSSCRVIRV